MLYCPLPMSRLGDELRASSLASLCPRAWHIVGAGFAYLSHDRKLRSSWTGWRKAGLAEGWVIWESSPHCPAWLAASHTAAASGSMQMGRACLKVTAVPTPPASLWPSNLLSTFPGSLGLLSGGPVPAQSPCSPLSAPPTQPQLQDLVSIREKPRQRLHHHLLLLPLGQPRSCLLRVPRVGSSARPGEHEPGLQSQADLQAA